MGLLPRDLTLMSTKVVAWTLLALGFLVFLFAAIGTSSAMVKGDNFKYGIFSNEISIGGNTEKKSVKCDDIDTDTDCGKKLKSDCGALKFFSVMAILVSIAAFFVSTCTALPFVLPPTPEIIANIGNKIPWMVGSILWGVTGFCMMVVWCIVASLYNGDDSTDRSCGYKRLALDFSYGGGFGLFVVGWLFSIALAVLHYLFCIQEKRGDTSMPSKPAAV
eukprot:m.7135 g.7135  ORF g.7135 m.7135 type:complete len:219 (+) comp3650_c0_seq1:102-758(+)